MIHGRNYGTEVGVVTRKGCLVNALTHNPMPVESGDPLRDH